VLGREQPTVDRFQSCGRVFPRCYTRAGDAVMRHSRDHRSVVGLCAFALLLVLTSAATATRHSHTSPSDTLYDDACPDLRLATSVDSGGLRAQPSTGDFVSLPEIGLPASPAASFVRSIWLARADARGPPLPA